MSTQQMESPRALKTITRNMVTLYSNGKFEDLLAYQQAVHEGLNRHDYIGVQQAFKHQLNNRGMQPS